MQQYQHLFFDLDHTLWDFEKNSEATLQYLYTAFALDTKGIPGFTTFLHTYNEHNEKLWDRFRKGFIKREELRWKRMWLTLLDYKIGNVKLAEDMGALYLEYLPKQTNLLPNAHAILEYCRSKAYKMHLITNGFEKTQWEKLRNARIDHYFGEIVTSERANSPKPDASIFNYALALTKAPLPESIMIGDALEIDIIGAANIGMHQVYYNPSGLQADFQPTYTIADLIELKGVL